MRKSRTILLIIGCLWAMVDGVGAWEKDSVIVTLSGESVKEDPCGAVLEATGIAQIPQGRTRSQGRWMAQRGATVRAYRNLVRAVDRLSPELVHGEGIVSTTGFVRGAKVVERRFLPDGRVEVRVVLEVRFANPQGPCGRWVHHKAHASGLPVTRVDRRVDDISQEEWIRLNQ